MGAGGACLGLVLPPCCWATRLFIIRIYLFALFSMFIAPAWLVRWFPSLLLPRQGLLSLLRGFRLLCFGWGWVGGCWQLPPALALTLTPIALSLSPAITPPLLLRAPSCPQPPSTHLTCPHPPSSPQSPPSAPIAWWGWAGQLGAQRVLGPLGGWWGALGALGALGAHPLSALLAGAELRK